MGCSFLGWAFSLTKGTKSFIASDLGGGTRLRHQRLRFAKARRVACSDFCILGYPLRGGRHQFTAGAVKASLALHSSLDGDVDSPSVTVSMGGHDPCCVVLVAAPTLLLLAAVPIRFLISVFNFSSRSRGTCDTLTARKTPLTGLRSQRKTRVPAAAHNTLSPH